MTSVDGICRSASALRAAASASRVGFSERRRRAEEGRELLGLRRAALGRPASQHAAAGARGTRAGERIGGGRHRQAEAADALTDRAVEMIDAHA